MSRISICICACLISLQLFAQDRFTYVSDRQFFEPSDLFGYQFVPAGLEKPGDYDMELSPGEYSFGITAKNLYIKGEDIDGVFSINNINSTDYGFRLLLMNARNPALQGHLKIILTKKREVEALVLRRSKSDSEVIFLMAQIPAEEQKADKAFFSNYGDLKIETADSLWGKSIRPFFRIDSDRRMQERLTVEDSVKITFIENVEVIEKIKKTKKKKKRKEEVSEIDNPEDEVVAEEEEERENIDGDRTELTVDDAAVPPITQDMVDAQNIKTKIIKTHFVEVKSFLSYTDGTSEMKVWTFPIEKVSLREDEMAQAGEEKFQMAFEAGKGKELYLYMTEDYKVTAFEMGSIRYEMR